MKYEEQIRSVKDYIRLPLVYEHWYVAGLVEEFGQAPVGKTLLERSIVFYRTEAGDLVAMQNRCLHRSFPLSKGFREGDNLVCRYHGIRYAPDGSIVKVPCQDRFPDWKMHVYPVKEVGPFVFIWMGDPDQPDWEKFPDLPFLEDPTFRTVHEAVPYDGSYLLMHENLLDLTHFAYLHKDTFGIGDYFLDLPVTVQNTKEGVCCNRIDSDPARVLPQLPPDAQERAKGKPVERHDGGTTISPAVHRGYAPIYIGAEDDPDREVVPSYIMHYMTPETSTSTHYFWSITTNVDIENDARYAMAKEFASTGFAEDKWAAEEMQRLLDDDHIEYKEMSIAGDKAGMLFRRVMLGWVVEEHGEETS